MVRKQARLFLAGLHIFEIALTVGTFFGAYAIRRMFDHRFTEAVAPLDQLLWLLLPIAVGWSVLMWSRGLYESYRGKSYLSEFFRILQVVVLGVLCLYAVLAMTKQVEFVNRSVIALFAGLNLAALSMERGALRGILRHYRKRGYDQRNIIIVGTGKCGLGPEDHRLCI
jgi:FlaA1/EpsC-like NDP-sugar epimerase